jgi:hypothetical protein
LALSSTLFLEEMFMSAKRKSAATPKRILVRAKRVGIYNSRRRYPVAHGHKDGGQPFYVVERKRIVNGEEQTITAEQQIGSWMEVLDEGVLKKEAEAAAAKAKEEELVIEEEVDQTGIAAPPGPGDEGEIRAHPNTVGEEKKRKSRKSKKRASDEEVI